MSYETAEELSRRIDREARQRHYAALAAEGARRERIATAALQAMELPNGSRYSQMEWDMGVPEADAARAAKLAVIQADALIAELDRKGEEG